MIFPYEKMATGADLANDLRDLGFTHAYLSTRDLSTDHRTLVTNALQGQPVPAEAAAALDANPEIKWLRLLCDAIAGQELEPIPLPEGAPGLFLKLPGR